MFGVINCQQNNMFAHIFGPLTLDPFIEQIKIAAKTQPGLSKARAGGPIEVRGLFRC